MKLLRLLFVALWSLPAFSQAAKPATPPSTAPVVTDSQKSAIKDFQLTDSNLQVTILDAKQKQQENQQRASLYISTLCHATDGKQYSVHFPDLTCAAVVAATPTPDPSKK